MSSVKLSVWFLLISSEVVKEVDMLEPVFNLFASLSRGVPTVTAANDIEENSKTMKMLENMVFFLT